MESQEQPLSPRRARVNMSDLVDAFDMGGDSIDVYLDLEAGEVIPITDDIRSEMSAIYEDLPASLAGEELRAAVVEAIENRGLPGWMDEPLMEAIQVEDGLGTRFIKVPQTESRDGYEDMEAFIETVTSPSVQEVLTVSIDGRGAFGRFKNTLTRYPAVRERWFAFKDARTCERVREWLADEGIELIEASG